MNTTFCRVFGTEVMLAMVVAAFVVFSSPATAQQEDPMPAVDTSAYRDAVSDAEPPSEAPQDAAIIAPSVSRDTSGNQVMDSIELGRTEITGNQELPKVLYIVPWQKSDPGDLMGRPVNSLLDEVLAPIDREEFVRQVDYYNDLQGKNE
jgi:hypothetical protein